MQRFCYVPDTGIPSQSCSGHVWHKGSWHLANTKHQTASSVPFQTEFIQTSLTSSILAQLHQKLKHLLTDSLSSGFINFIFFKLQKRTLFSMNFFFLTYFTQMLLVRKFPFEIKLRSALTLQELLQIQFCSGGLLSPQLWQVSNYQGTAFLFRQNTKSIPFSTVPFYYCSNTSTPSFL